MAIERLDAIWVRGKLLNFRDLGRIRTGLRTHFYEVRTRRTGTEIGCVRWEFSAGRYGFSPIPEYAGQAFSNKIVLDIQEFCDMVTKEQYSSRLRKPIPFKKRRERRIQNLLKKPDGGGLDRRYAPVVQ
jgi:hypothetical protein